LNTITELIYQTLRWDMAIMIKTLYQQFASTPNIFILLKRVMMFLLNLQVIFKFNYCKAN